LERAKALSIDIAHTIGTDELVEELERAKSYAQKFEKLLIGEREAAQSEIGRLRADNIYSV
jgi:hypothetical protein